MGERRITGASCCGAPQDGRAPCAPQAGRHGGPAPAAPGGGCAPKGARWIEGVVSTAVGSVPRVSTALRFADRLGSWKARWAVGRMRYRVEPGLYAVGNPTADSLVFVSANYKMSFDRLRSSLDGRDGWILVLDTKGINVWCAAGKGTFGTDELVERIEAVRLGEVVSHNTLVVPQLGATGVSAHEVRKRSGCRVVHGPVRAEDLLAFLDAGMKASAEMRRVRFGFRDRIVLVPVELAISLRYLLLAAVVLAALGGVGRGGYSVARVGSVGLWQALLFVGAFLVGSVLLPALLPWLPGRAFSTKGVWVGLAVALASVGVAAAARARVFAGASTAGWLLLLVAVASFSAMNFTGASTYTSLSGVRREMRIAVPLQIVVAVIGIALLLAGRFI